MPHSPAVPNQSPADLKINTWYRDTERELYNYPRLKVRLANLESYHADLYPSFTRPLNTIAVGQVGDHGDITAGYVAHRLHLEEEIDRTRRRLTRIETSLAALSPEDRELAELIYIRQHHWGAICRQLHISRSTYYEKKRSLVTKLAFMLGFLK